MCYFQPLVLSANSRHGCSSWRVTGTNGRQDQPKLRGRAIWNASKEGHKKRSLVCRRCAPFEERSAVCKYLLFETYKSVAKRCFPVPRKQCLNFQLLNPGRFVDSDISLFLSIFQQICGDKKKQPQKRILTNTSALAGRKSHLWHFFPMNKPRTHFRRGRQKVSANSFSLTVPGS